MAALIDQAELNAGKRVELHEGGWVWLVEQGGKAQEIKLDAAAAQRLLDVLREYENWLAQERGAPGGAD